MVLLVISESPNTGFTIVPWAQSWLFLARDWFSCALSLANFVTGTFCDWDVLWLGRLVAGDKWVAGTLGGGTFILGRFVAGIFHT